MMRMELLCESIRLGWIRIRSDPPGPLVLATCYNLWLTDLSNPMGGPICTNVQRQSTRSGQLIRLTHRPCVLL